MSYTRPKIIINEINNLHCMFHDAEGALGSWKFLLHRNIAHFRIVKSGFPDVKALVPPARLILRKGGPRQAD